MIERLTALMERPDALAGVQSEIQLINTQLTQTQAQIKQLSASIRRLEKNNNSQSRPGSALVSNPIAAEETSSKLIVGEIEVVQLSPPGLRFPARIDTGAETSSLDAREMKVFERDGDRWVRFQTIDPQTGEAIPLEARVSRKARILQSSFDESERRPVVELSVTIGHITQLAEFTLSDRSHLSFPVLIGRNVLRDMMLVDVGLSHTMNQIPSPAAPAASDSTNRAAENDTVEP